MSGELVRTAPGALASPDMSAIERVIVNGDIAPLTADQRVQYYRTRCEAAGLDWRSAPFEYLRLNGKLILYAKRTATDQLAALHRLSAVILSREHVDDLYVVTARVSDESRQTDDIGAVNIKGQSCENLANAMMKAVTKAIRRATLRHCGLGMMADSEPEQVKGAVRVEVNDSGEEVAEYPLDGSDVSDADAQLRAARSALRRAFDHRGVTSDDLRLYVAQTLTHKPIKSLTDLTIAATQKLARAVLETEDMTLGQLTAAFYGVQEAPESVIPSYMAEPEPEPLSEDVSDVSEPTARDAEPTPEERHADALKACMAQFGGFDLSRMSAEQQRTYRLKIAKAELGRAVTSYKDLSIDELHILRRKFAKDQGQG